MATHHFPTIAVSRRQGAISEHFVFGERNSGTNLAHQLFVQNKRQHRRQDRPTGLSLWLEARLSTDGCGARKLPRRRDVPRARNMAAFDACTPVARCT